jgi:hypothetical protein
MVADAKAPAPEDLAAALGTPLDAVERELRSLADAHVIALDPGRRRVMFAPPFSAVPTAFRVVAAGRAYFAPCAWDAFGIPAALRTSARIEAACAWSGDPVPCGVEAGRAYGSGVIHLLVPAAHFWDDIGYT